jgi:hypothetical protein
MNHSDYLDSIPAIQRLFRSAFGKDVQSSYLKWRYADQVPAKSLVTIEKIAGLLVAHCASTPLTMQVHNRQKQATLIALAMTDPEVRGQGLFQKVASVHEAELREQGFAFTYAFPNRNSDPIFLSRLGWLPIYEIPNFHLNLAEVERIHPEMGTVVFDDHFERFDYDAFVDRCGLVCQLRDTAFLRWRYAQHPLHRYRNLVVADSGKLNAYGVCKPYSVDGGRQLDLVDFFASERQALRTLMRAICKHALELGCVGVNTWSPRHHFSHQYLGSIGFRHTMPVTTMDFKSFEDDLTSHLRSFSSWWITMGDSDVY